MSRGGGGLPAATAMGGRWTPRSPDSWVPALVAVSPNCKEKKKKESQGGAARTGFAHGQTTARYRPGAGGRGYFRRSPAVVAAESTRPRHLSHGRGPRLLNPTPIKKYPRHQSIQTRKGDDRLECAHHDRQAARGPPADAESSRREPNEKCQSGIEGPRGGGGDAPKISGISPPPLPF